MGILDRLGNVIRSYLHDGDGERPSRSGDPDYNEAWEEIDDFLGNRGRAAEDKPASGAKAGNGRAARGGAPENLRRDFAELGVEFGAPPEACKAAYKRLLKLHHPDRHAGHAGNMKKATEKSARINAAYDRIERWRNSGGT
jgi:DnaJ-domain-containing protein 1